MSKDLPIWLMEPEITEKRDLTARKLLEVRQKATRFPEVVSIQELKQRIKKIRQHTRD